MRDGSWTGRGYLGAAKLSGACEPEGKISVETPSAALALVLELAMTPPAGSASFTITSLHANATRYTLALLPKL